MMILDVLLAVAAVPVLAAALYLAVLALFSRTVAPAPAASSRLRFDILVPAHNEETEIAATVASLVKIAYPRDQFRVIVVADNCTDATAVRAAAAGARVLTRQDAERRGKGYALEMAFAWSVREGFADVMVVVDADTLAPPNLLSTFAARFDAGARVVQADYGVRNTESSWRTRLMTIALAAFHGVRSLARERLGLSCGLRGNGMGFRKDVIVQHPPKAYSIVEDLEYGIHLGYAGIRVEYVHEATVRGYMAVTENASRAQRRRWERGRKALVREHVMRLFKDSWVRRDWCLFDLAMDLVVPPLGQLVAFGVLGFGISLGVAVFQPIVAPWLWGTALLAIGVYVFRAWVLSGTGVSGLFDLMRAPIYVLWKLTLRFSDKGRTPQEWVRTTREVSQ